MKWSPSEEAEVLSLHENGKSSREIADLIGRKQGAVKRKLYDLRWGCDPDGANTHALDPRVSIPPHVIEDRDWRMSLVPRDLTAALMGDPVR